MYRAKALGKNRCVIHSVQIDELVGHGPADFVAATDSRHAGTSLAG